MRPRTRLKTSLALTALLASCTDESTPTGIEQGMMPPVALAHLPPGGDPVPALIVTGTASLAAHVKAFDGATNAELASFLPYSGFAGGVSVAVGDVNGDGLSDIVTGAGPGAGPHVKVFDGAGGAELRSFFAYDPAFAGGVFVAAGDVNGDGAADIVTGAGPGAGPHVKVFDGQTGAQLASFFAYDPAFGGGVRVAAGDVNGDGRADLMTGAGPGMPPNMKVFDGATGAEIASLIVYASGFRGGVYVASGDLDGDGDAEVVTGAGPGAFPQVKVFNGSPLAQARQFMAYDASFSGGISVAAGDVTGDGHADIVTGTGAGAGPHVKVFNGDGFAEMASFFAYAPTFLGGIMVAAGPAGEASAPPTIEGVIAEAEAALANGSLAGAGKGKSARGRAGAWLNMLDEAQSLIESGEVAEACQKLRQVYRRADGLIRPPDFVGDSARADIAELLVALMEELEC